MAKKKNSAVAVEEPVTEAWARGKVEEPKTDTEAEPTKEEPVKTEPVKKVRGKVANCERLNIRKGTSTDTDVVGVLKVDTIVTILEDEKIPDGWYKIKDGYVMSKYIKLM